MVFFRLLHHSSCDIGCHGKPLGLCENPGYRGKRASCARTGGRILRAQSAKLLFVCVGMIVGCTKHAGNAVAVCVLRVYTWCDIREGNTWSRIVRIFRRSNPSQLINHGYCGGSLLHSCVIDPTYIRGCSGHQVKQWYKARECQAR